MNQRPLPNSISHILRTLQTTFARTALVVAALVSTLAFPRAANAQRAALGKTGERGHLAIDQISGFRAGYNGGLTYYGIIGFAVQKSNLGVFAQNNGNNAVEGTRTTTTFFLAPSADYFVIDQLSIGAQVELAFQSGSDELRLNQNSTTTFKRPSTTSITLLPRIGYLFPISNRFAIWPRAGIGYTSQQTVVGTVPNSAIEHFGAALVDLDVGFLYRLNEAVYLRMAPDLAFSVGGSRSQTVGPLTFSSDASVVNFSAVAGIGVMLDLL
jgi:hypothetical protein